LIVFAFHPHKDGTRGDQGASFSVVQPSRDGWETPLANGFEDDVRIVRGVNRDTRVRRLLHGLHKSKVDGN